LKKDRKIRAAKKYDSETYSDSDETVESVLTPFPKLHSHKAMETKKVLQNISDCRNVSCINTIQPVSSSQPVQSVAFEYTNPIKSRKRNKVQDETSVQENIKKPKRDNVEQNFQENFKENMQCTSTGMCNLLVILLLTV